MSGQSHSSAVLLPGKSYQYPFYRRMHALLQKMYTKDLYVHKLITRNVTHKLHNVRYNCSTIQRVYAYLETTRVCFAIDCTCSLSVSDLFNIKITCGVYIHFHVTHLSCYQRSCIMILWTIQHCKFSFGELNCLLPLIICARRAWGLIVPSSHGFRNGTN